MNEMCRNCKKRKVCKYISTIDETLEYLSVKMDDDIIRVAFKCLYREDDNNGSDSDYIPFSYNPKCGYTKLIP